MIIISILSFYYNPISADDAFCAFVDRMNLILKFNWFKETENYEWLKNEVFYEEFSAFPFKYYNSYLKKTEVLLVFHFIILLFFYSFILLFFYSFILSFLVLFSSPYYSPFSPFLIHIYIVFRWIASLLPKI